MNNQVDIIQELNTFSRQMAVVLLLLVIARIVLH